MGESTVTTTTHQCDRCRKEHVGESIPSTAADPWGRLRIDQPSGFDGQGTAWAPRMREPLLLCGACIEEIVQMVNGFRIRFDGPPAPESGRFVEVESSLDASLGIGTWVQEGEDHLLVFGKSKEEEKTQ